MDAEGVADKEPTQPRAAVRALLAVAAIGLVVLATLLWSNSRSTAKPDEGPWAIVVSYPLGDSSHCFDNAVEHAWQSTDYPGSRLTVTFVDETSRADVERVLSCMQESLTSGGIQVEQSDPVP